MIWITWSHFVELNDVGMAYQLQDLDLSGDSFDIAFVLNFLFL